MKYDFVRLAVYRIHLANYCVLLGPLPNMVGHFNIHSSIKAHLGFPPYSQIGGGCGRSGELKQKLGQF